MELCNIYGYDYSVFVDFAFIYQKRKKKPKKINEKSQLKNIYIYLVSAEFSMK